MHNSILYRILRPLIKGFTILFIRPKFIGLENIPKKGKVILAGNHISNFDCVTLISSTKRSIHFLAKDELWKGPKKIIFGNLGLIPVNRRTKDANCIILAEQYLSNDELIGIFPEGTTEKGRGLLPFKKGAVKIAKDTKSTIIPFVIKGKYKLFSKVSITFGKPIKIKDDIKEETERLRNIIEKMLEE